MVWKSYSMEVWDVLIGDTLTVREDVDLPSYTDVLIIDYCNL